MAAERKDADEARRVEHLTLVALYEVESRADELLERLSALGVETGEATIVRVDLDERHRARGLPPAPPDALSPLARYAVTGAVIGAAACLIIGLVSYQASALSLPLVEGAFAHTLALMLAGAVVGAGIGAALASARQGALRGPAEVTPLGPSVDGFLVVVKIPPRLAEEAEAVARRLGAKEIIF